MQPTDQPTDQFNYARARSYAALGLTAAVHALLWMALVQGARQSVAPAAARALAPQSVMTVALVAQTAPPPAPAFPAQAISPPVPEPVVEPVAEPEAERDALYYYFPQELDRELMVLIDRSDEADITLAHEVIMHLLVAPSGKVAELVFEGAVPQAIQAQLRAAFMTMEFLPGLKGGQPVPARIKIVIAPGAGVEE